MTDCDPANYAKVHRKPRCPVPGCKEKMTAANTYRCKDCRVDVCLKHRFAKDHRCKGKPGGHEPRSSIDAVLLLSDPLMYQPVHLTPFLRQCKAFRAFLVLHINM